MPSRPLHILFFTNSLERGGAEEHMLTLLRGFDRLRFRATLVTTPPVAKLLQSDVPPDVELLSLTLHHPLHLGAAAGLRRILRRRNVDVLHSHLFYSSLFASPIGRLAGVPVIVETPHVREHWRHGPIKGRYFIDRAVGRTVTHYIAVSEANAAYLRDVKRVPAGKISVIRNGSDLKRFQARADGLAQRARLGYSPKDLLLVAASRLAPQKGHRVLLDALPAVLAKFPQTKLACIGDGELRAALERQARDLGIERAVRWAGFQKNVPDWLAAADVGVLPSHFEGLPLFAIEALACGLPMVATAVDGTPEVVVDGYSGLLVPPGDSRALAEALCKLLASAELRRGLGEQGRAWVNERFSEARQIAETENLYERLWHNARTREAKAVRMPEPAGGGA